MIVRESKVTRLMVLTFLVALALAGCGKGCGKQEAAKKESLQLIPSDSNAVIAMNWKKLQASPMGSKMTEGVPPEALPFLKDVDQVVIGLKIEGVERDAKEFVGIVSGKLDTAALLNQMTEQAKKSGTAIQDEDYSGVKIYSSPKDENFAVAFINGQAAFGKKDTLKRVIDLSQKKGDAIDKNKAMMDLINGVDKNKMLWAVATIPEGAIPAGAGGGMGNPMNSLASIKALDLGMDYDQNFTLDLGIIAATKEDAQQMMTMANSYKTLFGASLASKSPDLGKVLGGVSIDAKENKVLVSLKLDQATVEDLAKKAKERQAAMPPMGGGADEVAPPPPPAPPSAPESAPSAP